MKQLYLEAEQKLLGRGGKELEPHRNILQETHSNECKIWVNSLHLLNHVLKNIPVKTISILF